MNPPNLNRIRRRRRYGQQPVGKTLRIALAGNPNAGKTSLFNALTGQSQHVGNYPGVTVEKKSGQIVYQNRLIEIIDLPGTYSLSAYSLEEIVARDFVLQEKPDVIIDVIDSTNLERNLYLCLQFQELGVPLVGALNMSDEAEKQGIKIDEVLLGEVLGIPLVKTVGTSGNGKEKLLNLALSVAEGQILTSGRHLNYGPELEARHEELIEALKSDSAFTQKYNAHWIAIKLLEDDPDAKSKIRNEHRHSEELLELAEKNRTWIRLHFGQDSEVIVGEQRYAYIHGACREAVTYGHRPNRVDHTELIDNFMLHRYFGLAFFIGIMFLIYQLTFSLGHPLSNYINYSFTWIQNLIMNCVPDSILRDLVVEGIIGGVGGVLVFFPIVLFLFLGLSFLEDTGYMARAAFVMDKFMHLFGLHGRSFIPMMVSTGCAVPGIMSARTLANPKDRVLTIMISPLMMCGAKTPVIAMLTAAFFPKNPAVVFWAIWLFGWILALTLARLFRNILFKGETSPFVMELPPYRVPTVRGVVLHMWEKSWAYIKKAGTFILAASIVMWFILYFPGKFRHSSPAHLQLENLKSEYKQEIFRLDSLATFTTGQNSGIAEQKARLQKSYKTGIIHLENQISGEELHNSFGGSLGRLIAPIFKPCGFDWRLDVTLLSGLAAKEVIISSMGIIYGIGESNGNENPGTDEQSSLTEKLKTDPDYSQLNMLAFMLFVLTYIPCIATFAAVKKELGKWKYPAFLAVYTFGTAWLLATLVFQIGTLFKIG